MTPEQAQRAMDLLVMLYIQQIEEDEQNAVLHKGNGIKEEIDE